MKRGLHLKMVLIMLLLIVSLMTVVGAFLINGVVSFYTNEFYEQMRAVFSDAELVGNLRSEAAGEDAAAQMNSMLAAYSGPLGIDTGARNHFILDGAMGQVLSGSDSSVTRVDITPNILTAITGSEGYAGDRTASYMDVALPISSPDGGPGYIVYIRDNKQTVRNLNAELYTIIAEALVIGLVISVLMSFLLSKTMVTHIESLTAAAKRVALGDFSDRIEVTSNDEIGTLTDTFNDMATRLSDTLEEIEAERSKLSTLFLHMTDGVVAFDGRGGIMHSNPAAAELLGINFEGEYEYGELFGDIAPPEEVMALKSPDYLVSEAKKAERDLEISLAPLPLGSAGRGLLVVIHDITEQKRAERLQREFVANVSHEMRTPLTSIRSYAETLGDGEVPEETRKRFLSVIVNESDRMARVVQDLLTLSSFDAHSLVMDMQMMDTADVSRRVYNAMALQAENRGHELTLEFDTEPPVIYGDPSRLEQVFINIISNAVKYTPDGGRIEINCGVYGDEFYMSVRDNGVGIPAEDLPRVFDRFYRVDKARSRESGGSGLGLAIVSEIVHAHSGRVEIVSEPGKGTNVTVWLPARGGDADNG